MNNEYMFTKKTQDLKEKEALQMRSSSMELAVVEACKIVPKIHIPEDAQLEAKIRKLATGVCEAKVEVAWVTFEFKMKIAKF